MNLGNGYRAEPQVFRPMRAFAASRLNAALGNRNILKLTSNTQCKLMTGLAAWFCKQDDCPCFYYCAKYFWYFLISNGIAGASCQNILKAVLTNSDGTFLFFHNGILPFSVCPYSAGEYYQSRGQIHIRHLAYLEDGIAIDTMQMMDA